MQRPSSASPSPSASTRTPTPAPTSASPLALASGASPVDKGEGPPQAVVTGASSGIGLAVVRRLQKEGHQVFGVARRPVPKNAGSLERTVGAEQGSVHHELPSGEVVSSHAALPDPAVVPDVVSVQMDLACLKALPKRLKDLARRVPRLGVLVLAAGRGRFGSLEESSYEQIGELIDLNVTASLFFCRALLPIMKRNGVGKVVFIGSESGLRGKRQGSIYCASKFAVRGMAQALRDECSSCGVAVSVIQPGMVRTPFFDELGFEPGPNPENALSAEDVAEAVRYIVSAPSHAVVDEIELSPLKRVVQKRTP